MVMKGEDQYNNTYHIRCYQEHMIYLVMAHPAKALVRKK